MDGEGARLHGGRWNSPGVKMVYTSGSISLAVLEQLVHFSAPDILTSSYVIIPIEFDDSILRNQPIKGLPSDWQASPPAIGTQQMGDNWVSSGQSVVYGVPSVIVPQEMNYLLNPQHTDFTKIVVGKPVRLELDARLLKD